MLGRITDEQGIYLYTTKRIFTQHALPFDLHADDERGQLQGPAAPPVGLRRLPGEFVLYGPVRLGAASAGGETRTSPRTGACMRDKIMRVGCC